jgi:dTMP kinase
VSGNVCPSAHRHSRARRPGGAAALIAVVGTDGAGKSTLTALLESSLTQTGLPARQVGRWDIVGNPSYPTGACLTPVERQARSCAARMSSTPRLLFLLWADALALADRDGGLPGETVLLDGYWMKHAAGEIAFGADRSWVEAVTDGLPPADLVVYLRVDPELAWLRKDGRPLPFECGMDHSCAKPSFLAHQSKIQSTLDGWARRFGWLTLDATVAPELLVEHLVERIVALTEHARAG